MNNEDFDYLLNLVLASVPKMTEKQQELFGFKLWALSVEMEMEEEMYGKEDVVRA